MSRRDYHALVGSEVPYRIPFTHAYGGTSLRMPSSGTHLWTVARLSDHSNGAILTTTLYGRDHSCYVSRRKLWELGQLARRTNSPFDRWLSQGQV